MLLSLFMNVHSVKQNFLLTVMLLSLALTGYGRQDQVPPAQQLQEEVVASDSLMHINTIVERTQLFFENIPIEKVHVHFDKPYYAVGDTVWFKAYLASNMYHFEPSKVLYMEVMTGARDSVVQVMRVPLKDRVGHGQLVLDQQWFTQGNYRFRAYTKWMVNFGPEYFFNQIIPVGDVLNHSLHTQIRFEEVPSRSGASVKAHIEFTNRGGQVLANRRVNWQAVKGFEPLASGRAETNAMGQVTLDIQASDREKLMEGILNLSVEDQQASGGLLVGNVPLRSAVWDVDVQFFPEGGDLLAGFSKRVAFKAVASDGYGAALTGTVQDSKGQTVATLESLYAGMGYFHLFPEVGERYTAHLTFENGQTRQVELPEVQAEGINLMKIREDDDHIQMAIAATDAFHEKYEGQTFGVLAQADGILGYAAQATLKNQSVVFNLPRERFPTGVAQMVLFSPTGVPLSERLFYVESLRPLEITVQSDRAEYATKDPVQLQLAVLNNDSTFLGNFSVSVVDETKVPYPDDKGPSILSNFLLSNHLTGYIENPQYYFNPANEDRAEAMDALLMTQGYKRFSYPDFIAQNYPEIVFMPEQGIELSGTLRYRNGRPVVNGGLLLSIPDHSFRKATYTDEQGRFVFNELSFTDSVRVTINARGNDDYRNMVIHMDQSAYPVIDENIHWADGELNIDLLMASYLTSSRQIFRTEVLLDEVEVTVRPTVTRSYKEYPALSGLSMADHQIGPERLQGCTNLLLCLPTILTGITYDSQQQHFYITRDYNMGGRIPVQFFVNGMPMDPPSLASILPHEVEGIEIFLRDQLGVVSRTYQNNGVVSIYTTKPAEAAPRMSLAEIERLLPKDNIIDMTPLGYLKTYEFYVPKYDTPESKQVADYRSTIYWNPSVNTDEQGQATVHFYNADGRGPYRVIVEGMDATGNFGRTIYRYQVK